MAALTPKQMARFWAKVDKPNAGGCWLWNAGLDGKGYGQVGIDYKSRLAHRVAYELLRGPIPEGLVLDHLCRQKRCVNPAHLEPVTLVENFRRGHYGGSDANLAKTHCPQGHPYDEANTLVYRGARYCRACNRERQLKKRRKEL